MAWTAGVDRTTGALISASDWNSYLGVTGSLMYLKAGPTIDGPTTIAGAMGASAYPLTIQNTTTTGFEGIHFLDASGAHKLFITGYNSAVVGNNSFGAAAAGTVEISAPTAVYIGPYTANTLSLGTNGVVRATFDGTTGAFVVSGAASATYPVDVTATSNGNGRSMRITNTGNSTAYAAFQATGDTVTTLLASMSSGYSSPYTTKSVLQSNAANGLMIQNTNNGPIQFYVDATGATLAASIDAAGLVGIATATDSNFRLYVNDSIATTDGTTKVRMKSASATGYIGTYTNHPLVLRTNDTDRWSITSAGHFLAGADNTYDIGASGATRPRTGYFATALAVGTTPATGGAIRLTNADWITARNAANSNDINLLRLSSINIAEFTVHVIPTADNAIDLGGGNRWRDVYCARGAFNGSSRTLKRNISPLAAREALDAVLGTEIVRYQYNPMGEDDDHAERWHVGYIAEDAPDMLSPDHTSVTPQTTAAVAMAALQELDRRLSLVEARP